MNYKIILNIMLSVFIANTSLGAEKEPQKNCDVAPCRKYIIERSFKAKVRCVSSKYMNAFNEAPLVEDTNCSLIVSKIVNKKKTHYSVLSNSEYCSMKKGSEIELGIRKGSIQKGREGRDPCPSGSLSVILKEDNPPTVVEGKELEQYVDANVFGLSNPHYPY